MPPAEEWDFRAVDETECPLACYWEYTRSLILLPNNPNSWIRKSSKRFPIIYEFKIGMSVPPAPWKRVEMAIRCHLLFFKQIQRLLGSTNSATWCGKRCKERTEILSVR